MSTQQHANPSGASPKRRSPRRLEAITLVACIAGGAGTALALEFPSATIRVASPRSDNSAAANSALTAGLPDTTEPMPLATAVRFWTTTTGCVATKIGPRRFLTAAHCVDDLSVGARLQLTHRMDGRPATTAAAHLTAVATAIHIHPSYAPNQGLDLALVDLAQNSARIPVLDLNSIDTRPLEAGSTARLIGNGCDRHLSQAGRPRHVELVAAPRASSPGGEAWDDWFGRFIVSFTPSTLSCHGNSGAPVFHERSGRWWLVGVNKGIERNQGSTAITRIAPALPWLSALSFATAHRT